MCYTGIICSVVSVIVNFVYDGKAWLREVGFLSTVSNLWQLLMPDMYIIHFIIKITSGYQFNFHLPSPRPEGNEMKRLFLLFHSAKFGLKFCDHSLTSNTMWSLVNRGQGPYVHGYWIQFTWMYILSCIGTMMTKGHTFCVRTRPIRG